MKSPAEPMRRHWGARALRANLDVLAIDPEIPQAFPATPPMDWKGRIQVRLCAEGSALVGYGFGDQRFAFPASEVGAVRTVTAYRMSGRRNRGTALLIFDTSDRVVLRARGLWETYGEVAAVCRAAGAPAPEHIPFPAYGSYQGGGYQRGSRPNRKPPRYPAAPGCRRLRTVPRGRTARVLAQAALFLLTMGCGILLGLIPAVLLPETTGAVRTLFGVIGAALGAAAGVWLGAAIAHVIGDAVRWLAVSLMAGTAAPLSRFFRRRKPSGAWSGAANVALVLLVPAFIAWGPGIGIASLVHGISDSRLVADLRAHGVATVGRLIDVPRYSTASNGDTTVTDVATLAFTANPGDHQVQTGDPGIGGRPLPLDSADPGSTNEPLTVIYDPRNPDTAAAAEQIQGSVWHGAPTSNMISASIITLLLPVLIGGIIVRFYRLRRRAATEAIDDLATVG